jgi:hypothetical protein
LLTIVIVLGLLRRLSDVLERLEAAKNVNDLELGVLPTDVVNAADWWPVSD